MRAMLIGAWVGCVVAGVAPGQDHVASFEHGAVAAAHPLASEAGARMLRSGGNAVDAAVAASFTLSVVRPQSCGIGGGGFMVIYLPDDPTHGRVVTAINYRETAPGRASPDMFTAEGLPEDASTDSGLAIAVPGTVAGLMHALEHYGTKKRWDVMQPAIDAGVEGFVADEAYVAAARAAAGRLDEREREARPYLWKELLREGEVAVGDVITNVRQANALASIANDGGKRFYNSSWIPIEVRDSGGVIEERDLMRYEPVEAEPLRFEFAGRTFLTMPPPSSGGVVLAQVFGVLERKGITERAEWSAADSHVMVEAMKHAFADRAVWLGDPAFVDVPVERLTSAAYIGERAAEIDPEGTLASDEYGTRESPAGMAAPPPDDSGTSHLCAVDQWGGAVACTETINLEFGSLFSVEQFGFCLNNEMDDFTARPGEPNAFGLVQSARNAPEPGKRPLSSMTPTIVLDAEGRVEAVAGGAGGPRIISGTLQALMNVLVRGMEAGEALAWPRLHHQWMPDALRYEIPVAAEEGSGAALERPSWLGQMAELAALGHKIESIEGVGTVQLIVREGEGWRAACEPGSGGAPAGH